MKKLFAFLLAISLCFTLVACGGDNTPADDSAEFVKPTGYATVLVVTINPQFRLYLDKNGAVLATEPLNEDAKAIMGEIKTEDASLEGVVKEILIAANEKGFVKADATANFEITETTDVTVDTSALLTKAKDAFEKTAKDENIVITVEIKNDEKTESDTTTSTVTDTEDASDTEAMSDTVTESDTESESDTVTESDTESSASTHQHIYENATCTEPKKCSCGDTEGSALGHNFENGKCTRCGADDPDYAPSFTSVKEKLCNWEGNVFSADGNTVYSLTLVLHGDEIAISADIGDKIDPDMPEAVDAIEINGNLYYFGRGSGNVPLNSVTEDGTTVTVVDGANGQLVLTRVDETTLKVTASPDNFGHEVEEYFAVGKIPVDTTLKAVTEN